MTQACQNAVVVNALQQKNARQAVNVTAARQPNVKQAANAANSFSLKGEIP